MTRWWWWQVRKLKPPLEFGCRSKVLEASLALWWTVVLADFTGQSTYDTKGKTAVDSAYRYDPRFDTWLQIASLNEKRTFFHLSALKGKLFAVGGRNTSGEIGEHGDQACTMFCIDIAHFASHGLAIVTLGWDIKLCQNIFALSWRTKLAVVYIWLL